jgi:DHA1 family tetracycline resistance protein-like MFS transporter
VNHREPRTSTAAGRTLFAIVLIDLVGFGIVLPILPAYAAEFSSSETAIGALVASFSFMQFLVAPWWGRLSDRIGRRPVILLGLASSAASYLLFAVAQSYWLLLFSRVLAGGVGATVNVAQAYLADITPPAGRARAMGMIGMAFGLAFIIGPALAALTSQAGAMIPGGTASAFCALSLLIAWRSLPESRDHQPSRPVGPVPWGITKAPYLVMLLSVIGFAVITVVFPLFTSQVMGLGRRETSMFFVLMGVSSAVVQGWLLGKIAPRLGEQTLMIAGSVLLALGLVAIPLAHSAAIGTGGQWTIFLLALVALSAGTGFVWPAVAAFISRETSEYSQGSALGMLHSIASMARVVGPILIGFVGERGGFSAAFYGAALMAAGAAVAGVLVRSRQQPAPADGR